MMNPSTQQPNEIAVTHRSTVTNLSNPGGGVPCPGFGTCATSQPNTATPLLDETPSTRLSAVQLRLRQRRANHRQDRTEAHHLGLRRHRPRLRRVTLRTNIIHRLPSHLVPSFDHGERLADEPSDVDVYAVT